MDLIRARRSGLVSKRRLDIDILRIVGILFVVMYHYGSLSGLGGKWMSAYIGAFLSCCVPIFFFVSGVLHARRSQTWSSGFSKAVKLLVLTVLWSMALWIVISLQRGSQIAFNLWVAGILTFQQGYTNIFWFLPAMAIVYMLAPIFSVVRDGHRDTFRAMVIGACLAVFALDFLQRGGYIAGLYFETDIFNKAIYFLNQFNPLRGIYGYSIAYFLVGMYIGGLDYRPKTARFGVISLLLCIVSPIGLAMYKVMFDKLTNGNYDPVFGGYSCISTLTVSLYYLVGILTDRLPDCGRVSGAIKFLGANAFAVYLLHMFVRPLITTAVQSVWPAWIATAVSVLLAMSAVVVLTIIGSILRRTKMGSWLLTA